MHCQVNLFEHWLTIRYLCIISLIHVYAFSNIYYANCHKIIVLIPWSKLRITNIHLTRHVPLYPANQNLQLGGLTQMVNHLSTTPLLQSYPNIFPFLFLSYTITFLLSITNLSPLSLLEGIELRHGCNSKNKHVIFFPPTLALSQMTDLNIYKHGWTNEL